MKSKKANLINFGVISLIGLGSLFGCVEKYNAQEQEYNKTANSVIKKVEKRYDKDNNGVLSLDEGIQLARAVGYKRPIPKGNVSFKLHLGDYSDESIFLKMKSPDWKGDYRFRFPLSTLEELAK